MNTHEARIVIEAALLCAQQPMTIGELRRLFADEHDAETIRDHLEALRQDWQGRGIELCMLASGWRFQSTAMVAPYLERLTAEKPPKYSRAVLETLAIVAYRQPVTRGDIEETRGVSVSAQIIKTLEERGWIEMIGHKDVIGRPALFGTTRQFLDDLGLQALSGLPPLGSGEASAGAAAALEQQLIALAPPDALAPPEGDETAVGELTTESGPTGSEEPKICEPTRES